MRRGAVLASDLATFSNFLEPRRAIPAQERKEMIEPVDTQDFTAQPERRKPEQFEHVKFRIDAGVAKMTLNRPEHNLLNEAMLREIAGGITHAGERDDVKLIVLDSACKVFCGGIDIGEYTSQRVFQMLDAFHAAFSGMLERSEEHTSELQSHSELVCRLLLEKKKFTI